MRINTIVVICTICVLLAESGTSMHYDKNTAKAVPTDEIMLHDTTITLRNIFPPDGRERVIDTTSFPWSTICKIYSTHPDGIHSTEGSGVMIDESHVLTAGHLIYFQDEYGWPYDGWASEVKVIPGYNSGYEPFGHSWATHLQSPTEWTELHMREHDWGLITLDSNTGYTTGWLEIQTAHYTDPMYIEMLHTAGYPSDLDNGENMYYCSGYGDSADEHLHYSRLDAYQGQSGSPIWRMDSGKRYVLSVLTTETPSYTIGTRITTDKYDIIVDWLGEDNEIYVDDNANSSWYDATHVKTINEGICNVSAGGTVLVFNGTYYENIIVNKPVYLIGEDKGNTVIVGRLYAHVIHISADYVSLTGFTILSDWEDEPMYGVFLNANHTTITDNNIKTDESSIVLYSSRNNTITDNTISDTNGAISLTYSDNNTIIGNTISNNNIAIELHISSNNTIADNYITSNNYTGLFLHTSCNTNIITGNNIENNGWDGVEIYYSSSNIIARNNISMNNEWGIGISSNSKNNYIYHNNLMDNNNNAYDRGQNRWNNGYPSGGNYWSDFDELSEGAYDMNSDGIIEIPYDIPRGNNQDLYPLMDPWDILTDSQYWNIWDNDEIVTTVELQEIINHWVNVIPKNDHIVTTSELQVMINIWLNS